MGGDLMPLNTGSQIVGPPESIGGSFDEYQAFICPHGKRSQDKWSCLQLSNGESKSAACPEHLSVHDKLVVSRGLEQFVMLGPLF